MLSNDSEIAPRAALMFGTLFARVGRDQEARTALELAQQSGHPDIAPMAADAIARLDTNKPD
jgi:hypothetical protein